MKSLSDDASLPETLPELKAEIAIIDAALVNLEGEVRRLMQAETTGTCCYAQELHALRQEKLVLGARRELRAVHIRRRLLNDGERRAEEHRRH